MNIPPFTDGRNQLEPEEVVAGRRIANTRIHVERAIGRIKEFKILSRIHAIHLVPRLNEIFFVCAMLTNFNDLLINQINPTANDILESLPISPQIAIL